MQKPSFDPGLTQQFGAPLRRTIDKDGGFNVRKVGGEWRDFHPYLHLVNMSWAGFFGLILVAYAIVNLVFACIYAWIGIDQLSGADAPTAFERFMNMFFFSSHTLSTVGYGNISPRGMAANGVASFEALIGVLGLAVATGLLFGRVSRPSARIGFSETAVIAPYQDITALEFRIINRRPNILVDTEARILLMTVESSGRRTAPQIRVSETGARERSVLSDAVDRRASHRFRKPAVWQDARRIWLGCRPRC